ncbi:ATP-grasp domain-containing protein [Zooshikella ganghwensis]|uniref:ATP-grasp domain-containing protein n=1 Tax=Zooshikella ganghwensis TaxID=202772 RepID=A0A4P9VPI1_9GAMM|nr:ATP-grasp domain-containing protein [Zooshikella ganghwensis]RDH43942.1 ATP-grasp domain-containing protein [Zooshikella ganghwensis]
MENILFIETRGMNPTGVLKEAISCGYHPIVATAQSNIWRKHLAEQAIECTLIQVDELTAEAILSALATQPIAVITLSDQYLEIGAKVAQYLSLPHTSVDVVANCRDKYTTRKLVSQTSVKQPLFIKLSDFNDLNTVNLKHAIGFPLIFKPLFGHSSLGVQTFYSQQEVDEFFSQPSFTFDFPYIVEGLIENAELFSVEGFIDPLGVHFLGCSSRILGGEGNCVELGGIFPYPEYAKALYTASKKVIGAIGMTFGAFHIEYLVKNEDVYLVEVNPRFPNGPAPSNISRALGVSLDRLILELFINGYCKNRPVPTGYAIARAIYSEKEGNVTHIDVPENLDAEVFISASAPFHVSALKSNADRFGFLITSADDLSCLDSKASKLMQLIKIQFSA